MIETEQALWIFSAVLQTVGALFGLAVLVYIFWYDKTRSQFREESTRIRQRALGTEMLGYGATEITLMWRKPGRKPEVVVDITQRKIAAWKAEILKQFPGAAPPHDPTDSILWGVGELGKTVVKAARRGLGLTLAFGLIASAGALLGFVYALSPEREVLSGLVIVAFAAMLVSMTWFSQRYLAEGQVEWLYRGQKGGTGYLGSSS